jgi:hypothetical protein
MESELRAGRNEEALISFLKDFVGVPPLAIDGMKTQPNWSARVAMANTLPREARTVMSTHLRASELAKSKVSTTMFLGSISPPSMKGNTNFICRSVPACQVIVLQGQGHLAATLAPDLFVEQVLAAAGGGKEPPV